jgi:hypothetical protein
LPGRRQVHLANGHGEAAVAVHEGALRVTQGCHALVPISRGDQSHLIASTIIKQGQVQLKLRGLDWWDYFRFWFCGLLYKLLRRLIKLRVLSCVFGL